MEFLNQVGWKEISAALVLFATISAALEKIFKVNFIWAFFKRCFRGIKAFYTAPMRILNSIQHIKEQQEINSATLYSLENEIKYNGGKFTLKNAVKEIRELVDTLLIKQELSNATLRASLYVSTDPIHIIDAEGRMTFINTAWARMIECAAPQEMMGYGWLRVIPEANKREVLDQIKLSKESPNPYSGELVLKNWKTGAEIRTYCRSTVVLDNTGKTIETIGALEILS